MKTNVLIIGGGGREHAIGAVMGRSPHVGTMHFAPGNPGTARIGTNVPIPAMHAAALSTFGLSADIGLAIVGPETALAAGVADVLRSAGIPTFGPSKAAAEIETSKSFAKAVMLQTGIPTASGCAFASLKDAIAYLRDRPMPVVVKADGLAAGKGVAVCMTETEAIDAVTRCMSLHMHGDAGKVVVIEQFLQGRELSAHVLCDMKASVVLPAVRDYKRLLDLDGGPNTGGMGAIGPVMLDEPAMRTVRCDIIDRLLEQLERLDRRFSGCLFPGLMLTEDGPKVLEVNARFGDPETQVHVRTIDDDWFELLWSCAMGDLDRLPPLTAPKRTAVTVTLVAPGYPDTPYTGMPITGIERAESIEGVQVFHGATELRDGVLVASGGRVLHVTAVGANAVDARCSAYQAIARIHFDGMHYRNDIGL